MKKKFKHYATDKIIEFDIKDSHVKIYGMWHKLEEFNTGIKAIGTSWVVYND